MRLPGFDHFVPGTIREACDFLRDHKEKAKVTAGGTDLLVRMKQKLLTPAFLVNLRYWYYNQSHFWRKSRR